MPLFGGLLSGGERYGGAKPTVEIILNALNAARGTAYDTESTDSPVWLEDLALAKAIANAWDDNERLANQFDPQRMTTLLARWEKILGLVVPPGDTDVARRARVLDHVSRTGLAASTTNVADVLSDALTSVFVSVVHNDSAIADVHWPGTAEPDAWTSTVALVIVLITQPAGMPDGEFYDIAAKVTQLLEPFVPAWVALDWVNDGVHGAGFYLDETHNLDNQRFD